MYYRKKVLFKKRLLACLRACLTETLGIVRQCLKQIAYFIQMRQGADPKTLRNF